MGFLGEWENEHHKRIRMKISLWVGKGEGPRVFERLFCRGDGTASLVPGGGKEHRKEKEKGSQKKKKETPTAEFHRGGVPSVRRGRENRERARL